MNLLDRLLGKNWASQVGATFHPKRFSRLSREEFTPGLGGSEPYRRYTDFLNRGLQLTQEGYDFYTGQFQAGQGAEGDWGEVWQSLQGGYGGEDPTESFSKYWVDPSEADPIDLFDPQSVMAGFERAGMEGVTKDMFTPFKASDIRGIVPSYYTGELEAARGNLAADLSSSIAKASGLGAGFAGYGGREVAKERARDVYGAGVENVYANIDEARALAAQNLYSKLEDYSNLIGQATTG